MPDDNTIPREEIVDLPKIDDENLDGISFVSEASAQTAGNSSHTGTENVDSQAITPKITPLTTAPYAVFPSGTKPSVTVPFAEISSDKPAVIIPVVAPSSEIKSPALSTRRESIQAPATAPKEMEGENKAIVRPEPLKMPVDQRFEPKPKETPPPPTSTLRAIRTYQADVAESVRGQKTSLVRMVMAEQTRKQKDLDFESPRSKRNIIFIIGGFILLLSGTVAAIIVFNKYKQTGTVSQQQVVQSSFIFSENSKAISIAGLPNEVIAKSIAKGITDTNNKLDTIENISVTENAGGGETQVTTQRLFYFLDNRMPPSLLRSLDKDFMLGVHAFNGNNPFIIFKTNFYENTFAGMLGWEQYMARDLLPVFGIGEKPDSDVFIKSFEDKTLKNRDTRVLKNSDGDILLLYTFKDKQTLIITTSGNTMEEVIKRLNSSGPINR